ncbi:UDP-3-O-acyl N-acetylglucosamine deacetylase [Wigglesworthia glossinidia endosymbiont of Glossina morsitans morsitans (Yale colony)]|uniref:UDP-3-O-acyl-N-acetylglucosamine deacetylase n=1 Tax=Wigglesworthia glossinidia endosymbiont of Glossina morsitans morsitans (Yale colony) TaxID=1142511 RepID=H6Q5B3_WIGGL|nr:UDP-3-O-acyl-N-acetylglucosamine deacetylase [Wigglesworthia glossinidia]AFA41398.1 UDP-3-O-acyl N-acetylglucosamine deacetylase [Wigglesworthia glossinidia endosymbiont of Glossina morsitans morsitans (Yale colony)]
MIKQNTLKKSIQCTGIGLHSGKMITLTLLPAPENTGIIYRRIDLVPPVELVSHIDMIKNTKFCTSLEDKNGIKISTIEHLSAALSGLWIDNIVIELTGSEIPIMDGSAWPFVNLILRAGVKKLAYEKKFIYIKKLVRVEKEDKWIEVVPHNQFTLDVTIDFNHPVISATLQNYFFTFSIKSFIEKISRARTFGFLKDIDILRSQKLALGCSYNCAIVIGEKNILNHHGLRFDNEFVRHKILDIIGDFFIPGYNILGAFRAFKPGHTMNYLLLKKILKNKNTWGLKKLKKNS